MQTQKNNLYENEYIVTVNPNLTLFNTNILQIIKTTNTDETLYW